MIDDEDTDASADVVVLNDRRPPQLDAAIQLAEKIIAVITANTVTLNAVNHVVALELAGKAIVETMRRARGDAWLNAIFVEAASLMQAYEIYWPVEDQPAPNNVVFLPRKDHE